MVKYNKKIPMFSSLHEGESVLRRANDIKVALEYVEFIKNKAEYLIKEVAQVAAMCEKIKGSIEDKNDEYNR